MPIKTLENKKVLDVNKIHFILEKEQNRKKILMLIENYTKKYLNKNLDQLNVNKIHLNNRWDDKDTFLIKKLLQFHLTDKLRIKIIAQSEPYFCVNCKKIVNKKCLKKSCKNSKKMMISGTKIRSLINKNKKIPEYLMHKKISQLLNNKSILKH